MNISVFGNPDLDFDSLPLHLVPHLQKHFPNTRFLIQDPNELDLPTAKEWVILDTVQDLDHVRILSIEDLRKPKSNVTAHDFDLGTYLLLVCKLKKDIDIHIVGIPMSYPEDQALAETIALLRTLEVELEKV